MRQSGSGAEERA